MATHSLLHILLRPLSPRSELLVRRALGAVQAILAALTGIRTIQLTIALYHDKASRIQPGGYRTYDPHGFGFMALAMLLIPSTVLFAFGAASVWRNLSVSWWLPLLVILALWGGAYMLLL